MKVLILSAILKETEEVKERHKPITLTEWPELRTWHQFWIKNLLNRGHTVTALNFLRHGANITKDYDLCLLLSGGTNFRRFPHLKEKPIPLFIWWEDSWEHYKRDLDYKNVFLRSKADLSLERDLIPLSWWRADNLPVVWFPCAVDEDYWYKMDIPKENDLFFSGKGRGKRIDFLEKLAKEFKCDFHVFEAEPKKIFKFPSFTGQIESKAATFPEYRIGINKARLGFECSKIGDLGGRPIEVMGCGTACISERTQGASKLFEEGKEIIFWDNWKDLFEKTKFYLTHEEERERIAKAGYEKILKKHLWSHRIAYLEKLYEAIVNDEDYSLSD